MKIGEGFSVGLRGMWDAWGRDGLNVIAEMLSDGSVNYYAIMWNSGSPEPKVDLFSQGHWETRTVNNVEMILMEIPIEVNDINDEYGTDYELPGGK